MTWNEILADLHSAVGSMNAIFTGNFSHLDDCYLYWLDNDDHNAIQQLYFAVVNLNNALGVYYLQYWNAPYSGHFPCFFAQYIPAGAAITWEAIAEAWIANDFEGRAVTIALIDRMRQILWDEPFNVTWAARPEQS